MGQNKPKTSIRQVIVDKLFAGTFLDRKYIKGKRQVELAFIQAIENVEQVFNVRSCFIPEIKISPKQWYYRFIPRNPRFIVLRVNGEGEGEGKDLVKAIRRCANGCKVEPFVSKMVHFLKLCLQAEDRYNKMRKRGCAYKFRSLYYKP